MTMRAPQESLSAHVVARKLSRRSSSQYRQASKRRKREKAMWTHCRVSLDCVTRLTEIEVSVPSDLLWGVKARVTGQLLGGAMQLLPSRADPRTAHRKAEGDCIPPIHPEEDLYPLNVLRALSCNESMNDRDVTREVLSEEVFRSLSMERAETELQVLGVPLQQPAASLSTLLPGGKHFYAPMFKT